MKALDLLGVAETLQQHARPSQIAFMLYELLNTAGYTDEEIRAVVFALGELATNQETQ